MSVKPRTVLVVGGGVIGSATAWYLAQRGCRVQLLEQNTIGSGASHGNCGLLSPSHVLPLTVPGVIGQAVRWMGKPDAPLYIKPRLDPTFWRWGVNFARRCHEAPMLEAADARHSLLQYSMAGYQDLFDKGVLDCGWSRDGAAFVFKNPLALAAYRRQHHYIDQFGVQSEWLDGEELAAREPALRPGLAGAVIYTEDGHLQPDLLMQSWRRALAQAGVEIVEQCRVHEPWLCGDHILGLRTSLGEFDGDSIVLAGGAWTPKLASMTGVPLPIQPGKGYSLTSNAPDAPPTMPCLFYEARMFATPWKNRFRLGGTMEFSGYNAELNPVRLNALKKSASAYLRTPIGDTLEPAWTGWRPMTYDGIPIIDRSPAFRNIWVAAGHNMLGISLAPGTGKLLAQMICDEPTDISPAPYNIARFNN